MKNSLEHLAYDYSVEPIRVDEQLEEDARMLLNVQPGTDDHRAAWLQYVLSVRVAADSNHPESSTLNELYNRGLEQAAAQNMTAPDWPRPSSVNFTNTEWNDNLRFVLARIKSPAKAPIPSSFKELLLAIKTQKLRFQPRD